MQQGREGYGRFHAYHAMLKNVEGKGNSDAGA